MKRLYFVLLFVLLLTACQAQTSTPSPIPPANTVVAAASKTAKDTKGTSTPVPVKVTPIPATAALHSSSLDPNAGNLVAVRDQSIINNSLTIDTIISAKAGWIVLYFDKEGAPGHYICYVPVPVGKTDQFVIPLNQSSNLVVGAATLHGRLIDAVLQTGTSAPGKPVSESGRMVFTRFTINP